MYKIEKFEVRDPKILSSILEQYPFATVTSIAEGKPFVNHFPITPESLPDGRLKLLGHMSLRNPQWRHIEAGSPLLIAFTGPHTYVNPSWYVENDVPTWNYIVVHASGRAKLVADFEGLVEVLKKTTAHMNRINKDQWDFLLPSDLERESDLLSAIIGFEIIPDELIGKFKLSQNRTQADQSRVISGLRQRNDEGSRGIADWMSKLVE